jgi:hypothetical protein
VRKLDESTNRAVVLWEWIYKVVYTYHGDIVVKYMKLRGKVNIWRVIKKKHWNIY